MSTPKFVPAAPLAPPNAAPDRGLGDMPAPEFRRWALEVSRYSFATGQEVFARYRQG